MRCALFALLLAFLLGATEASAQTTPTFGEKAVGSTDCKNGAFAADFDTLAQCTSTSSTTGTMQKAPIFVGAVTSPPYPSTTCDANKAGMMQYTASAMQYCNGTEWVSLGSASTCNAPNAFSFTDQTGLAIATTVTSNAVTLSGSGFSCAVGASCTGCTDIVRNGIPTGATSGVMFLSGDTIALKILSSTSSSTATTATVTVGKTTSSAWSVTTGADLCAGSPAAGVVCLDGTLYAGLSPDGSAKMYTTRCDVGMTWSGSACTGTRSTKTWNKGTSDWTNTGYTSNITGRSNTTGLAGLVDAGSPYVAAKYCEDLVVNGRSDWYLPAKDELNVMYTNKTAIGNFLSDYSPYWSSTESGNYPAVSQRFNDGTQHNGFYKSDSYSIRCVRR